MQAVFCGQVWHRGKLGGRSWVSEQGCWRCWARGHVCWRETNEPPGRARLGGVWPRLAVISHPLLQLILSLSSVVLLQLLSMPTTQHPSPLRGTLGSSLRSPAEVEGNEGFPPQPEKDHESPSSTPLEELAASHDSRVMTSSPSPCAWRPDFPGAAREAP